MPPRRTDDGLACLITFLDGKLHISPILRTFFVVGHLIWTIFFCLAYDSSCSSVSTGGKEVLILSEKSDRRMGSELQPRLQRGEGGGQRQATFPHASPAVSASKLAVGRVRVESVALLDPLGGSLVTALSGANLWM